MVALQIRDVPDDIRRTLAERAAARGQSLQAFLLTLITEEAHRSTNGALLERFGARHDGSQLSSEDVIQALDEARAARKVQLTGILGDAETNPR